MVQLPQKRNHFIQGQELPTDEQGRVSLNALHKISGAGRTKEPGQWLRLDSVQELITEFAGSQDADMHHGTKSNTCRYINREHGGANPGTYAHELLAISYAGWISPRFQIEVNAVFSAYKNGMIEPMYEIPQTKSEALRLAADLAEENEELKEQNLALENLAETRKEKSDALDRLSDAEGSMSFRRAFKTLGIPEKKGFQFFKEKGLISNQGGPWMGKAKPMEDKLFLHVSHTKIVSDGTQRCFDQCRVTAKGLAHMAKLLEKHGHPL